ncbi:hypothetical protein A1O3_07366 [Capronia epimyces CBS 606.96]|uniref:Uncharacterized protein n=1 Tax=Capronia epimyces CBS 606.96 TaxID=1182542 RepID=W9XLI7_9EURO|nr:uncharacterized protein A1O3_07366 [Capronia epimyces CBS 606.96]EXJ81078.1 hypothetical protein A1O3_07366 [Capronia epimyces CBS 606.96]
MPLLLVTKDQENQLLECLVELEKDTDKGKMVEKLTTVVLALGDNLKLGQSTEQYDDKIREARRRIDQRMKQQDYLEVKDMMTKGAQQLVDALSQEQEGQEIPDEQAQRGTKRKLAEEVEGQLKMLERMSKKMRCHVEKETEAAESLLDGNRMRRHVVEEETEAAQSLFGEEPDHAAIAAILGNINATSTSGKARSTSETARASSTAESLFAYWPDTPDRSTAVKKMAPGTAVSASMPKAKSGRRYVSNSYFRCLVNPSSPARHDAEDARKGQDSDKRQAKNQN